MVTPGVTMAASLLRDFRFVDPTWEGSAFLRFWESELDVSISPYENDGITPRQLDVLRAVLAYPWSIRTEFERALFAYYNDEIDGSYCSCTPDGKVIPGSGPPKITEPSQLRKLIDEPKVCIRTYFETNSAVELELRFNCEWDPEHGLGVLYRYWQAVDFGQWHM